MIDIKIVANRFVTCFAAPPPKPEEETWPQKLAKSKRERDNQHRRSGPADSGGILGYVLTKADHEC